MNIDNIVRDLQDLIHDVKQMEGRVFQDRMDTSRSLNDGDIVDTWQKTAKCYEDGLIDAQNSFQNIEEFLQILENNLGIIIEDIGYRKLSYKVQEK